MTRCTTGWELQPSDTPLVLSIISRTPCSLKATMSFSTATTHHRSASSFCNFLWILEPAMKIAMIIQTSSSHAYIPILEPAATSAIDAAVSDGGDRVPCVRQAFAQSAPTVANDNGAAVSQAPTYLRDIQPIFMGNCSRCHNQQSSLFTTG